MVFFGNACKCYLNTTYSPGTLEWPKKSSHLVLSINGTEKVRKSLVSGCTPVYMCSQLPCFTDSQRKLLFVLFRVRIRKKSYKNPCMIYPDSYTFEESFILGYSAELYIELLECRLFPFYFSHCFCCESRLGTVEAGQPSSSHFLFKRYCCLKFDDITYGYRKDRGPAFLAFT